MSATEDVEDTIHIEQLELAVRIGVPDEERERPQRLTASITIWPGVGFHRLDDRLTNTVDYAALCARVTEFACNRTDKLIETFAEAAAVELLSAFPIRKVRVELRKFILPDVKHVAVVVVREAAGA